MQHVEIVAYGSKQLKDHEKSYPTHKLEFPTMLFVLKFGGIICIGRSLTFLLIQSVKYLFSQKEWNLLKAMVRVYERL